MDRQDALRSVDAERQENIRKDRSYLLSQLLIERGRTCEPDKNSALGLQRAQQRNLHAIGLLHPDLMHDLEKSGFSWRPSDCAELYATTTCGGSAGKSNSAVHRNATLYSKRYEASLQTWVVVPRERQNEGSLANCEEEQLNSIGLRNIMEPTSRDGVEQTSNRGCHHDNKHEAKWNVKYELAVKHYQQFGHTFVHKSNSTLYQWVAWQRTLHVKGTQCKCREERLNKIQFAWSEVVHRRREQHWDTMYEKLKAYHEEHGTCRVRRTSNYRQLGQWVYHQHVRIIRGTMMPGRKAKLDLLGFSKKLEGVDVLHPEDGVDTSNMIGFASNLVRQSSRDEEWEVMYEKLKAYKEKHGHCRVRGSEGNNEQQLKIWLRTQRRARQINHRPDRIAKLDLLGFFWNDKRKQDAHPPCRELPRGMKRGAEHLEAEFEDEVVTVEVEGTVATKALVVHSNCGKRIRDMWEEAKDCSSQQDCCASEKTTVEDVIPDDVSPHVQKDKPCKLGCSSTIPVTELQVSQQPRSFAHLRPCNHASREERWNAKYEELVKFYQKFGHSSVRMNDDKLLHSWCCHQRLSLRQGTLAQSRAEKLMEFPLHQDRSSRDEQWEAMFID